MICSICLNRVSQYRHIPCGHHICLSCNIANNQESRSFRCRTCLKAFDMQEKRQKVDLRVQELSQTQLYCLQCEKSFLIQQLLVGIHRNHPFDKLENHLPLIKQKARQKLNKGLILQNMILLNTQGKLGQHHFDQISQLISDINVHFSAERQNLNEIQRHLIEEVKDLEECIRISLDAKKNKLIQLYQELHKINSVLEDFVSGDLQYSYLDRFSILNTSKIDDFMIRIKNIQKDEIDIPKFICATDSKYKTSANCFLKYSKQALSQQKDAQRQKIVKVVNLRSKIERKLNCL